MVSTIHCQCLHEGALDHATYVEDQKCKEFNRNSGHHCNGQFTSKSNGVEYVHGAGAFSSAYLTKKGGILFLPKKYNNRYNIMLFKKNLYSSLYF